MGGDWAIAAGAIAPPISKILNPNVRAIPEVIIYPSYEKQETT